MTCEDLRKWLIEKDREIASFISVGNIDGNKPKQIGVYYGVSSAGQRICIGGKSQTKHLQKKFKILVHWTKSAVQAETKARQIYNLFYGISNIKMGGIKIISADPGLDIIPVGKDDVGIFEYVINITINHERMN